MGASTRHGPREHEAKLPLPLLTAVRDLSLSSDVRGAEPISFAVARGRAGLESIRQEWQAFVDRSEQVALAHAPSWYDAYLQTCADPDRVYFFVAYRRGELVAIFPFERRFLFVLGVPLPAWLLLYHDHMPFSDVIARPDELQTVVPALLQILRREGIWALISARNVLVGSSAGTFTEHSSFGRRVERRRGDCHHLDCGQTYESLLASFSRKHRANLRRHRSNLSALGLLETTTATDVDAMERCFGEFLEVEGSGWKGRAGEGTAIALHLDLEQYYRHLLRAFGSRGECELNLLRLNGRCIAAQFCVTLGGMWYLLKIGYDEQYAKYSPGSLLLEDALIRLCARPEVKVANLASDASWHLNWNPRATGMADHWFGAAGAVGSTAISLVRLRMRLAREFHRVRAAITARWSALRRSMSPQAADDV
jgi:CelD/BcsL family acetyltransferase involved in cellulose biosynthesis